MAEEKYNEGRPHIPADIRRAVEVESGHRCAIKECSDHTYLEVHHIDFNRANNEFGNLILLCVKHHRMAHHKVIDRKSLYKYKELLVDSYSAQIKKLFAEVERLAAICEKLQDEGDQPAEQATAHLERLVKTSPGRSDIFKFLLCHMGVNHFEMMLDVPFEHQVEFTKGGDVLRLDALRQDDKLDADIIIEVQYLRKSYADAPVYGKWLESKLDLYELLTGRVAKGVLLVIVGKERMKGRERLPMTVEGVEACSGRIKLEIFSSRDIGIDSSAISLELSQSYVVNPVDGKYPVDFVNRGKIQAYLADYGDSTAARS